MPSDDDISLDLGDEALAIDDGVSLDPNADYGERPKDLEAAAAQEMSDALKAFKNRAKEEDGRFQDATDSEYWFCICFQTRAQKDEFLKKMGWWEIGDKYLDGMRVAAELGIELESPVPPLPNLRVDWRLAKMAGTDEDMQEG